MDEHITERVSVSTLYFDTWSILTAELKDTRFSDVNTIFYNSSTQIRSATLAILQLVLQLLLEKAEMWLNDAITYREPRHSLKVRGQTRESLSY